MARNAAPRVSICFDAISPFQKMPLNGTVIGIERCSTFLPIIVTIFPCSESEDVGSPQNVLGVDQGNSRFFSIIFYKLRFSFYWPMRISYKGQSFIVSIKSVFCQR